MIHDILAILFLIILEGLLSFDNALALAALVKHLTPPWQKKALVYGMVGAFSFRILALFCITSIMGNIWVKGLGGGYLIWLCLSFFWQHKEDDEPRRLNPSINFWRTVVIVEITDVAFSIDSILASVAVSQKLWIVATGGVLGIIMMRFAAVIFIRLMALHPKLERSAFLLVGIVGAKLLTETAGYHIEPAIVWGAMGLALGSGFTYYKRLGAA